MFLAQDEDGKVLGRATQVKTGELEEGSRLKVGSKEVEVCIRMSLIFSIFLKIW